MEEIPQPAKTKPAPKTRDKIAAIAGTNGNYVRKAQLVTSHAPETRLEVTARYGFKVVCGRDAFDCGARVWAIGLAEAIPNENAPCWRQSGWEG